MGWPQGAAQGAAAGEEGAAQEAAGMFTDFRENFDKICEKIRENYWRMKRKYVLDDKYKNSD